MKRIKITKKIIFIIILFLLSGIVIRQIIVSRGSDKVTYQTAVAEKGTLISSIAGSGTITSGNYTNISTKVSGTVQAVYVTNGDTVKKGQKIAQISLDEYAAERQSTAWVAYLEATENLKDAQTAKVTADIAMWQARESVLTAQTNYDIKKGTTDGEKTITTKTLDQSRLAFTAAETRYLNADARVTDARTKVSAALRDYQQNSATIVAPDSGVISDLALAVGLLVNASSTTSSTSGATIVSAQTVGKISHPQGQLIASVSLTEIDITKVKANQKVTLTLDAYPNLSFTGKVLAVNTSGSISSGITSYPVTILLDATNTDIYPNMAVSAQIITEIKSDVITVPTTAITTVDDQSTVQIKKGNTLTTVSVQTGSANDSQTEIVSGLSVGDRVVTSTISSNSDSSSTTTSPFSGFGTRSGSSGNRIQMGGPPGL